MKRTLLLKYNQQFLIALLLFLATAMGVMIPFKRQVCKGSANGDAILDIYT